MNSFNSRKQKQTHEMQLYNSFENKSKKKNTIGKKQIKNILNNDGFHHDENLREKQE